MESGASKTNLIEEIGTERYPVVWSQNQNRNAIVGRLEPIDMLRGLVILIMALDHSRMFFFGNAISPTDLDQTTGTLFFTRWITHLCAPTFVFLAGAAAYAVRQKKGAIEGKKFLISRGLWLILMELTIVRFGWNLSPDPVLYLQVIWAIGFSMVLLGFVVNFRPTTVLVIGLLTTAFSTYIPLSDPKNPHLIEMLFLARGSIEIFGIRVIGIYAAIPWFGVMAIGFGFMHFYQSKSVRGKTNLCLKLGGISVVLFVVLRYFNIGDVAPWGGRGSAFFTFLSFMNVSKYPPSPLFLLVTLGLSLILLGSSQYLKASGIKNFLLVFGQVPLFVYIAHLYVIQILAIGISWTLYEKLPTFISGASLSLAMTYLLWGLVVLSLYPVCNFYREKKKERSHFLYRYI